MKLYFSTLFIAIFGASCGGGDVYVQTPPLAETPSALIPDETPTLVAHPAGVRKNDHTAE